MILYASLVMGSRSECVTGELREGYSLLGLKIGYSYEYAVSLLGMLSSEALLCYSRLLRIWDNLFPFLYGSMYIAWLSLIFKNTQFKYEKLYLVNLYPLIPMLADFIENYFENALLSEFIISNTLARSSVQIASSLTVIKWSLSMVNYMVVLTGIVILVIRWYRKLEKKSLQG
jgi:hypothetical protein